MKVAIYFVLSLVFAFALQADDTFTQEVVTGTLHTIWARQDLHAVEPGNPALGLWVSLHSDDEATVGFEVTLRYRLPGSEQWQSFRRTIDNTTIYSGASYWVSTPAQCIFWVSQWPSAIQYSVLEIKQTTLRTLTP